MRRLSLLVVLLGLIASGMYATGATYTGEENLLIFYSNDIIGETEPCG